MSKWLRTTLATIGAAIGAALWGFVATWLGAPPSVVGLGAVVIGAGVIGLALSES